MSKIRGSKLEAEVDKWRGECNWKRLNDLLPSIRAKNSGIERLTSLYEGEVTLEMFLEKRNVRSNPNREFYSFLRTAEGLLKAAIALNTENQTAVMEAHLLLSKLHYFSELFEQSLTDVENAKLVDRKTQFTTLRSLKLAAEGYAVKGFVLQRQLHKRQSTNSIDSQKMKSSFKSAVDLGLYYVAEFEKSINSTQRNSSLGVPTTSQHPIVFHVGDLLVSAMENAPSYQGIECYRDIMCKLSDKSAVEEIQQRLCRQLAEVLLRGSFDSLFSSITESRKIGEKSDYLKFYTGSTRNYFSPSSRVEEIILVLLISEVIATRSVRASHQDGDLWQQNRSVESLRQVHNLLSVVFSHLRQHSLLSTLMDRVVQYAGGDRYIWRQFGLALACTGRGPRAVKIFEHSTALLDDRPGQHGLIEHLNIARMGVEQMGDADLVMRHASAALRMAPSDSVNGRCMLLFALGFSIKARQERLFEKRRSLLAESVANFERAVKLDPKDDLTHLYCALEYAEVRNFAAARENCRRALELNPLNVHASILMALLLTAKHDYKSAMKLVMSVSMNFPNHYGLLVLRLRLEAKFGRADRALKTSRNLLKFWRKSPNDSFGTVVEEEPSYVQHTIHSFSDAPRMSENDGSIAARLNTANLLSSKDALVPVAPILTAPLGINASTLPNNSTASQLELSEATSNMGGITAGGGASTVSDSLGIGTSSSLQWSNVNAFRVRAAVWVELAELFIEMNYTSELFACVEEACNLFPGSHQTFYLKGRVLLIRADTAPTPDAQSQLRAEARAAFLAALAIHPAHVSSLRYLAAVYRAEAKPKMAEKMLREAVATDPLREDAWCELGRILAEQQAFEEANECFQTAVTVDGTNPLLPFDVIPRVLKSSF